jgi:hypothetical protein
MVVKNLITKPGEPLMLGFFLVQSDHGRRNGGKNAAGRGRALHGDVIRERIFFQGYGRSLPG